MLKRTLVSLLTCAVLTVPVTSVAQTIALYVNMPAGYVSAFDVTVGGAGDEFEVVTVVNTAGHGISAVEWVQTTLPPVGVFRLGGWFPCGTCNNLGDFRLGEFLTGFGGCLDPDPALVVYTQSFLVVEDVLGSDYVLGIRGFEPGDTRPSSFNVSPGFVDCSYNKITLTVQGGPALITGTGTIVPSGNVVLNPTSVVAVDSDGQSFSRLKAMFR